MNRALFAATLIVSFSLPLSESIKNLSFGVLSLLWLALILRRQNRWPSLLTPLACAHGLLVIVAFFSATHAIDPWLGFRGLWDVGRAFLFFLILATAGFRSRQVYWILVALVAGVVVGSFWGFYDLLAGVRFTFQIHSLGHQNHTATYLVMTQGIVLGFMLRSRQPRVHLILCFLVEALLLAGLIFTQSRVALFTTAVVFIALSVHARHWLPLAWGGLLGALVLWLITLKNSLRWVIPIYRFRYGVLTLARDPIGTLLQNPRLQFWKESLRALRNFPWLGAGPRNFKMLSEMGYAVRTDHAHSLYVNAAAEMGLLGLGASLLYLGSYFWTWRALARSATEATQQVVATAVLAAWLTIVLSGVLNSTFHTEGAMLLTGLMGLLFATVDAESSGAEPVALSKLSK